MELIVPPESTDNWAYSTPRPGTVAVQTTRSFSIVGIDNNGVKFKHSVGTKKAGNQLSEFASIGFI